MIRVCKVDRDTRNTHDLYTNNVDRTKTIGEMTTSHLC